MRLAYTRSRVTTGLPRTLGLPRASNCDWIGPRARQDRVLRPRGDCYSPAERARRRKGRKREAGGKGSGAERGTDQRGLFSLCQQRDGNGGELLSARPMSHAPLQVNVEGLVKHGFRAIVDFSGEVFFSKKAISRAHHIHRTEIFCFLNNC